jgi:hypothetical protein
MQGGLCEGLAVLSLRLAGDITALAAFQNTKTVAELIKEDPALLSEIAYWYVTQFALEVQEEASAYLAMSPKDLAEVLLYDFAEAEKGNPYTGFTIGIYSEMGGHAVTPYRVEEMAGGYRIYIYDSNWPNEERWIDVSNDGQWMYALAATNPTEQSEAWSGGTGQMLAIDSPSGGTKMWIQLLTGVIPTDNQTITGATSSATVLMNGTGVGQNHKGINTIAGALVPGAFATAITLPNEADVLRVAINQIFVDGKGKFFPNYILMHPTDVTKLDLLKITDGRYIEVPFYNGDKMSVARVPIIQNVGIGVGKYLVGDFNRAKAFLRDALTIRIYDQNEDDPLFNRSTVTANIRLAFRVKAPDVKAFVKGDFATDITALKKP